MIGSPTGGEDSDMESENEEILDATDLPNEVAGEVEEFQITSNEVMSDSDSGEQGSSEPTAKRAKKLAKGKDNIK